MNKGRVPSLSNLANLKTDIFIVYASTFIFVVAPRTEEYPLIFKYITILPLPMSLYNFCSIQ